MTAVLKRLEKLLGNLMVRLSFKMMLPLERLDPPPQLGGPPRRGGIFVCKDLEYEPIPQNPMDS